MAITIFYSWQTDSSRMVNRYFIEDALEKALKKIKADAELVNSMRDEDLALDKDTKGLPGTPPIAQAIFDKIDRCAVFVPDLTFVARTPKDRPTPNPNVLIEYGWALKSRGHKRIVPVMNAAFGEPSESSLPFNMRHLRWPLTYTLAEGAEKAHRSDVKEKLVNDLAAAIRAVLENAPPKAEAMAPEFEEMETTYDKAVFFRDGESLASQEQFRGPPQSYSVSGLGAKMFLRVIPTTPVEALTAKQAYDLATHKRLRLEPFDYILTYGGVFYDRNRYGAIAYRVHEGSNIEHLTQLLKNRELWGVNLVPGLWRDKDGRVGVLAYGYEDAFTRALGNYVMFAQDMLELRLPLRVIAGFTGIEGFKPGFPRWLLPIADNGSSMGIRTRIRP